MRHIHDLQPIIAHGLQWRDALPHAIDEDFTAAPGYGTEAGPLEISNCFFERFAEHLAKMDKLARAEPMSVDCRKFAFNVRKQIQIPLLAQLRMMPALHQNLRAAKRE